MGDEVLGSLRDPREVAHAQLVGTGQCGSDRQTCRVGQGPCLLSESLCRDRSQTLVTQALGLLEVEAQEIAAVVGHWVILTPVAISGCAEDVELSARVGRLSATAGLAPAARRLEADRAMHRCRRSGPTRLSYPG